MSRLDTESELQVTVLKAALRAAILSTHRVSSQCLRSNSDGNPIFELAFTAEVRRWAALCDLDLEKYDPSRY